MSGFFFILFCCVKKDVFVQKKLLNHQYREGAEINNDVLLVFENAIRVNQHGTLFHDTASNLKVKWIQLLNKKRSKVTTSFSLFLDNVHKETSTRENKMRAKKKRKTFANLNSKKKKKRSFFFLLHFS